MANHEIMTESVYLNGERYGYIKLSISLATYYIDFNVFGVSVPAETKTTTDYFHALNLFGIMRNKYNH